MSNTVNGKENFEEKEIQKIFLQKTGKKRLHLAT